MGLTDLPGYLGYGGVLAIHADWPNYPTPPGWKDALRILGNFPNGTSFYEVDDIDKCKLLSNRDLSKEKDEFDYKHIHIAIWHSDLLELLERGYIEGISAKSKYEFRMFQREQIRKQMSKECGFDLPHDFKMGATIDGVFKEIMYPTQDEEDGEDIIRDWATIDGTFEVTEMGYKTLTEISQDFIFSEELKNIIEPFIKINKFDSAVREASLLLETNVKNFYRKDLFGKDLIDFHINDIIKHNDNNYTAAIKHYRGELRTIFKFIRNEFAHNFVVLTYEQCNTLLYRINEANNEFKEVIAVYYE